MHSIEEQAIQTYNGNVTFFAQNYPDLHQKILLFDLAIAQGSYRERYELIHTDAGYFDVLNGATGEYLYGRNSVELAQEMAKQLNFKKSDQVIETYYKYDFDEMTAEYYDQLDICEHIFAGAAPIIRYANRYANDKTTLKEIYKYAFFGVGLGLHLERIDERIHAYMYLVVEDDLELFRLSMFVTDYGKLGRHAQLYFAVAENETSFQKLVQNFLGTAFIRNHYLKYTLLNDHYLTRIKQVQSVILTQSHWIYSYNRLLQKNIKVLESITEGFKFLNLRDDFTRTVLSEKPVLYIAAGPSLKAHIEWLKANHERFLIVAVFAALKTLQGAGIKPDIIIHIDERDRSVKGHLETLQKETFAEGTIFFFSASVASLLRPVCDKEQVYMFEDRTHYKLEHENIAAASVGETGYAYLLNLGVRSLYLLGLDLALDSKTGATHASDHFRTRNLDLEEQSAVENKTATLLETVLTTKGNFEPRVPTTPLFQMSIQHLNDLTRTYKSPEQQVYNLGNGAYFEGTVPQPVESVDVDSCAPLEKRLLNRQLRELFDAHASRGLTVEEKVSLTHRLDEVRAFRAVIEDFGRMNFSSVQQYIEGFKRLIQDLTALDQGVSDGLKQIYITYFSYIGDYIVGMFNTQELDNPKRHIKKVNKILCRQLLKIADRYMQGLEHALGMSA